MLASFWLWSVSFLCRVINFECFHSKVIVVIIKINHTIIQNAHQYMYDNYDQSCWYKFASHHHPGSVFMCVGLVLYHTFYNCVIIRNKSWQSNLQEITTHGSVLMYVGLVLYHTFYNCVVIRIKFWLGTSYMRLCYLEYTCNNSGSWDAWYFRPFLSNKR